MKFIILLALLLTLSCTKDDLLFDDSSKEYIDFQLLIKSQDGTILDQGPQSDPFWASIYDTLKLQAQLFKYDENQSDTTFLKNQYHKEISKAFWVGDGNTIEDIQILHVNKDSLVQEFLYEFFLIDLNNDTLRDTLRVKTLSSL